MNSRILVLVALVACAALCVADGQPKCPEFQSMNPFDISRYIGKWYEIKKLPNFFQQLQSCVTANYTIIEASKIKVVNYGAIKVAGLKVPVTATGEGVILDASKPAELEVAFFGAKGKGQVNYVVLDTDYENYTLIYTCYAGPTLLSSYAKTEYAWILSRERTLDAAIVARLDAKLVALGVDMNAILITDQSNC